VVQWAGDLDKDGKIDTYPTGHPLAGAIIWYPEELHDKGAAWYDGASGPLSRASAKMDAALQTKYNAIQTNDWALNDKAFPSGFAPALGIWPNGRFGAMPASGKWRDRFEFTYGERDNKPNQTANPDINVPEAYVFRFNDEQYRLVRYGFRQDGSVYKNMLDGNPLPHPVAGATNNHWFPYPPLPASPTTAAAANPTARAMYAGQLLAANKAAPAGPYPRTGTAVSGTAFANFGDLMGAQMLPTDAVSGKYRTAGTGQPFLADGVTPDPGRYGYLVTVTSPPPWLTSPPPTPTLTLGAASAAGAEPQWPYYSGGNLVAIRQVDGSILASLARPSCDTTPDTAPAFPSVANPVGPMAQTYGNRNNYTATYTDLYAEHLKTINTPPAVAGSPVDGEAGSRTDWRNPQSDWPKLIRIRVRLHDSQGLVTSYSDEFLINGRDDDGDGVVDNPEEGRISGIWFEYIIAVPYPMDPNPRGH